MTDHVYDSSKLPSHKCGNGTCWVCDGGLSICVVCGTLEGGIPTECPRRPCTQLEMDGIYAGTLDFRGEQWTSGPSVHTPNRVREWFDRIRSAYEEALDATTSVADVAVVWLDRRGYIKSMPSDSERRACWNAALKRARSFDPTADHNKMRDLVEDTVRLRVKAFADSERDEVV